MGLYGVCTRCSIMYVVCTIYCVRGVCSVFIVRFEGLSGVRVTGKTGKSGVSGELW